MSSRSPKEKVLHTRVPEALDAQIKAVADALRVPVSSLVRNILQDSVSVIDAAKGLDEELRRGWTEFQTILSENFRERSKPAAPTASEAFPDVIGWQSLTLNVAAECARCARAIVSGESAHLGVRDQPGPRVIICGGCLPRKES